MRIISLCPSLTELVFDLGCGADLVGITDWCVHPADRVAAIEKVGGTKSPDVARIRELAPDIVLMNDEENRREDADVLSEAGLKCFSTFPHDIPETAAMVRAVAAELNQSEAGERIAADIESRMQRVRLGAGLRARLRFAYLIWREPWMSVNRDTFAHALLELAGGENVFAEREQRYPAFELAQLRGLQPEVVFLGSEPYPFQARHVAELARALGLSPERVELVDGEYLSWHGSRTPAGIDYAEALLVGAQARLARAPAR